MSRYVIVHNELRNAINKAIKEAWSRAPDTPDEIPEEERGALFSQILTYYDEHGVIPDFSIGERES